MFHDVRSKPVLVIAVAGLFGLSCGLAQDLTGIPESSSPSPAASLAASPSVLGSTAAVAGTATEPALAPSATATAATVTVLATANLNIRRGPATAYDILGNLLKGQHAVATARNPAADWLLICGPADACQPGWVSATSTFVQLIGDAAAIQALPLKEVDPAVPAYLRNCTFHPMKITPGDFILKEKFAAPANKKQVNPGVYAAYDQNQEGHPKVLSVQIKEGSSVDIVKDGLGNTYSCP